jgi:hypothetical protein
MHSKKSLPRARRFVAGRRLERRERSPSAQRQAAQFDHPNESEFDAPEYVDQYGRQYRVAYASRTGGWAPGERVPPRPVEARAPAGVVRLWVRLQRGVPNQWWYAATRDDASRVLDLRAVAPGLTGTSIEVLRAEREGPRRRTGVVIARTGGEL